ncbi:MAG TPA: hypothetical protein VMG37_18725 [Solirubrobacteraceae bacterium]|nr:hypothetical protein [Solirubrobacteraceae bacterium]
MTERDARAAAALGSSLVSDMFSGQGLEAILVHATRSSGLIVGAAMDHRIDGPADTGTAMATRPDLARLTIAASAAPGAPLRVTKFVGYGWSGSRTVPAVRDQVAAALAGAVHTGWDGLLREQRAYLDRFWAGADSRSTATWSCSGRCASPCFIRSRRERGASDARFRPRG